MNPFLSLFRELNASRVKYLVAGGVAVNLYGIERATGDVDIAIALDLRNTEAFVGAAKRLGLVPKVPVKIEEFTDPGNRKRWREEKGMLVFSLYDPRNPFFLLDVMTEAPFDFDEVYPRRDRRSFHGVAVPVVPLDDLVRMKRKAGRKQDLADVVHLSRLGKERKG